MSAGSTRARSALPRTREQRSAPRDKESVVFRETARHLSARGAGPERGPPTMLKGLGRFMRREAVQKRRDKELGYDVRLPARLPDPTNAVSYTHLTLPTICSV